MKTGCTLARFAALFAALAVSRGLLLVGGRLGFWAPTYREAPVEPLEFFDIATWTWKEVAATDELPTSASNYHSATRLAD